MKIVNGLILTFLVGICVRGAAIEATTFGTFTGVLNHESLNKDQLVRLELIPEREVEGGLKLQGILTLQFGGFESTEYISYHYHDIAYNFLTGILTLNAANQEVYIRDAVIKNNIFEGSVYASVGRVGRIRLSKDNSIVPTLPLIEPLNGEYRGHCDGMPSNLQLYTYRSTSDTSRLGNPYGAYEVKGQFGVIDKVLCAGETKKYCTASKLQFASYDFFSGRLILNGKPQSYTCTVEGTRISCDNCTFHRVSNEMINPQKTYKSVSKDLRREFNLTNRGMDGDSSIAGIYSGYLYHEKLNTYQQVQIEITTYQEQTPSGITLMLSAIARLHFGESESEILAYKFMPIPFPNPLKRTSFILSRSEADVDAVIQVSDLRGGVISGQWNSIIFGKVGPFLASKNGDLPSLDGSKVLGGVTAVYKESRGSPQQDLVLNLVVNKDRAPLNSDNPFFPLNIRGWIWRESGAIAKKSIVTSSYDFYTGRVALLYGQDEVIAGTLETNSAVKLRRLGGGFGTFMQSFDLVSFRREK